MKTIYLILCLLFTNGNAGCPSTCNCTSSAVLCIDQNLEYIPNLDLLENTPIILDFSGNRFTYINYEDFSFNKSEEVKEIYLNNSEIADLEDGTFDEMENLQELYLAHNLLNSIADTLIERLENVILLDMSNNYFSGDMPKIKSKSLEVLAIANSKITNIPVNALRHLPSLKLLLLQQNNIKTVTYGVFKHYEPGSFFVRMSYNSWECDCVSMDFFKLMETNNFLDPSDPYLCLNGTNAMVNIYGKNGSIENSLDKCRNNTMNNEIQSDFPGFKEILDVGEQIKIKKLPKYLPTLPTDTLPEIPEIEDYYSDKENKDLDMRRKNENCWEILLGHTYSNDNFFMVVLVSTVSSFFLGFVAGVLFCRIIYSLRYKKLEQSSDSQVKLLVS